MVSIIVFSKGRPLQLHAYLESLLKFSDAKQEMITVLYCETEGIDYGKVMRSFPEVCWVKEQNFEQNLKALVDKADDYIMFGCDDVIFVRDFSLSRACAYLESHDQVFGFSLRLGTNIVPRPQNNLSDEADIYEWCWDCPENRYNYPWELDCTVYRKVDVCKLTNEEENPIKNPNYYEAMITEDNRTRRITRKNLAANNAEGCAIVITVNRVQDTHQNGYDDSMLTDIYTLDRLYNVEDNTLDIDRIARKKTNQVHVDSEYFILRKSSKINTKWGTFKRVYQRVKNRVSRPIIKIDRYFDRRMYRSGKYANKLSVLNMDESIQILEEEQFSFIRFGEGEIALMKGETLPFQSYDAELAERLKELLKKDEAQFRIGIPYYFFFPEKNLNVYAMQRALAIAPQRRFFMQECSKKVEYIDACMMVPYQTYTDYDFEVYYSRLQKIFENKDVTVICGEGILDKLQYQLLEHCKSVEYVYGPNVNAYVEYPKLLRKALQINKDRLVFTIMGPTAKVLAYDLYQHGYTVWDLGHLLKDYDAYKKQRPRTEAEIRQFYMPD